MKVVTVAAGLGSASFQALLDDVRIAFSEPWLELGGSFRRGAGECRYSGGGVVRWTVGGAGSTAPSFLEAETLRFLKSVGEAFANHNRRVLALYGLSEREVFGRIAAGRDGGPVLERLYHSVTSYPMDRPGRVTTIRRLM